MEKLAYQNMADIEKDHWWFKARREIINTLVHMHSNISEVKLVMEAGCGTGGNLPMLSKMGTLHAFELDDFSRKKAAKRNLATIRNGSLPDDIPFSSRTYDLIFILDVIEHIENDVESLEKLKRQLSPNGKIVITAPAGSWLWSAHDKQHHHYRRYSRSGFKKICTDAGLTIKYSSHFNSILFPFATISRCWSKLTGSKVDEENTPKPIINNILYRIFASESLILKRCSIPFGLSLIAICESAKK